MGSSDAWSSEIRQARVTRRVKHMLYCRQPTISLSLYTCETGHREDAPISPSQCLSSRYSVGLSSSILTLPKHALPSTPHMLSRL